MRARRAICELLSTLGSDRVGLPAWEPAQALSWSQWANSLWSELIVGGKEERLLLNAAQEHSVWRKIIAEDASATGPLAPWIRWRSLRSRHGSLRATTTLRGSCESLRTSHDSRIFAAWAESSRGNARSAATFPRAS